MISVAGRHTWRMLDLKSSVNKAVFVLFRRDTSLDFGRTVARYGLDTILSDILRQFSHVPFSAFQVQQSSSTGKACRAHANHPALAPQTVPPRGLQIGRPFLFVILSSHVCASDGILEIVRATFIWHLETHSLELLGYNGSHCFQLLSLKLKYAD